MQLQGQGVAQLTYWQKLADNVSTAADLQVITAGGRRDAQATLGAKWDFRMAT
jgi:mitochondrial import receptor subunit TOM40